MHPQRNLFAEFRGDRNVFVETGTYRGDAIQLALDTGFTEIYSMDIDVKNIDFVKSRFDLYRDRQGKIGARIQGLVTGNSATHLRHMLRFVDEPAVFWLDAHAQHLEDEKPGPDPFPLLKELEQIKNHAHALREHRGDNQSHVIIIDDMLHLTHPAITGWRREDIEEAVLAVDERYKIQYFANPVKDSILVASI
jgi:hypothetical protein